jgi:protein SCO1
VATLEPGARLSSRRTLWLVIAAGCCAAAALISLAGIVANRRSANSVATPRMTPIATGAAATWAPRTVRAPGFRLVDQNGAVLTLSALRGRSVIVTFIDPLCRDLCPLEARRLAAAVRSLPSGARPTIVAVNVNPSASKAATLDADVRRWRLPREWRWGLGSKSALKPVWRAYHVAVFETTRTIAGVRVQSITHNEVSYLVDSNGFQRALFVWPYSDAAVVRAVRTLG